MLAVVGTTLTEVLGWIGSVVSSLVSESGDLKELLGLFAIGISASIFMFAIKAVRRITWGA